MDNSLYNTIRNIIKQNTSIDINTNKKYKSIIAKVSTTLNNKNKDKPKTHMNSIIINNVVPVLTKMIEKDNVNLNRTNQIFPLDNKPLNTPPRPEFTMSNTNIQSKPSPNLFSSQPSINNEKRDNFEKITNMSGRSKDTNMSIMDRMKELEAERNYATQSQNEFKNSQLKSIETQKNTLNDMNKSIIEKDNEFFKNLYSNESAFNKKITIETKPTEPLDLFKDRSKSNILPDYDSNIDELKDEYKPKKIKEDSKTLGEDIYQNSNFKYVNEPGKLVVLDSGVIANGSQAIFNVSLIETFKLDSPCDIYLEFISLNNLKTGAAGTHLETANLFTLKIDQLPLKTLSNNANLFDKYVIPNETFGTSDIGGEGANADDATTYNIKLKSNYMCSVTPGDYNTFNITVQYLAGATYDYLYGNTGNGRVVIGLYFKKRN